MDSQKILNEEHTLVVNEKIDIPEDGLVLGNGDLCVGIYQKEAEIVWRFGKGDVWDRRHETKDDPAPLTIDELRRGIRDEGWCCGPCGGEIKALRGTDKPERMREVLRSSPSRSYPYPMPKPVGELALHWPADLQGLKITQKLFVKQGKVEIKCQWRDGEQLDVECFVHPKLNVLVVCWKLSNFDVGPPQPFFRDIPIWLSLYRWPDPDIREFAARWKTKYNFAGFDGICNDNANPLPKPEVISHKGRYVIQQKFYPDKDFPDGFRYWLGCITDQPGIERVDTGVLNEARLLITSEPPQNYEELLNGWVAADRRLREGKVEYPPMRDYSGYIVVPVTTSGDEDGCEKAYEKICNLLEKDAKTVIGQWQEETHRAAREFWSASGVKISEKTLENLWYEVLHTCRCVYRKGAVPPGLFIPCFLNDYVLWHGDYHTNYNFQQCFWGFLATNHCELVEAYFKAMEYISYTGKKIARDYFNARGIFVQLCGYPIVSDNDPVPTSPMGRMPYMTGWAVNIFWWYYLYTQDIDFLRERAYPFIRSFALFYLDFLERGEDGLYHAFPSSFGEEGYTGEPEKNTDAPQTMIHAQECLRIAIMSSKILETDDQLRNEWRQRLDNLAKGRGESEWEPLPEAYEPRQQQFNAPEFRPAEWHRYPHRYSFDKRWWSWIQFLPWSLMRDVRGGQFEPKRDFEDCVKAINRWRHKNGLLWPMPARFWGRLGPMTESFGIIAPVQEMMLQSWDGVIRVFPVWPMNVDAEFVNFRAEGAFLVSARCKNSHIEDIRIESSVSGRCQIENPWRNMTARISRTDTNETVFKGDSNVLSFETQAGKQYVIECLR